MAEPAAFATVTALESFLRAMADVPCEDGPFSELAHGLQCADVLRALAPDDIELQVAGLLHDVGQTLDPACDHGEVGAEALRGLMGERIAELVRLHVDAKRYLVTRDPAYRATLSPVSIATLALQGGDLSAGELAAFEASPFHADAVRLRKADDLAKVAGKRTSGLEAWSSALHRLARPAG
jgi:predicted HD phosphohydrolase